LTGPLTASQPAAFDRGFYDKEYKPIVLTKKSVDGIQLQGGTILGTSRGGANIKCGRAAGGRRGGGRSAGGGVRARAGAAAAACAGCQTHPAPLSARPSPGRS
jgi:hypothetical protein